MDADLQRRRCPHCGDLMPTLARLTTVSTTTVLERYGDTPPDRLPDGAQDVIWMADPCLHALNDVELWDAMVEAGWGNDAATTLCAPIPRQTLAA
jgi:hypothetical protein